MKITKSFGPTLFLIGSFCLIYGLGISHIRQNFDAVTLMVTATGGVLFLFSLLSAYRLAGSLSGISFRKNLGGTLIVLFVFLVVVLLNYSAYLYNIRWDATEAKQHTLTADTRKLLEELSVPIRMTVLFVGLPPKYLEDLLREYEDVSQGMIQTEIINPIEQIGYAAQFGHIIKGNENKVVVQSEHERQDLDFTKEPLSEEALNNAIIRVTREARTACFLTGHGEYSIEEEGNTGLTRFAAYLKQNNILSEEIFFEQTGGVPDRCDILIVAGPKEHLRKSEEESINQYLRQGGDALFLVEHLVVTTPDIPLTEDQLAKNPSLNSLLIPWGLKVNDDVVVDVASHAGGDMGSPATRSYMTHKAIVSDLDYTVYIRPRSVSMITTRRSTIRVAPLVLTASEENSWGETDRTLNVKFDKGVDRPGPVPIAYVVWEKKEGNDLSDTRMALFTDADFLSNQYISFYSNAQMAVNLVQWLTELDYQSYLGRKEIKVARLDLTSEQKRQVVVLLVLMPIFIAMTGVWMWMRR